MESGGRLASLDIMVRLLQAASPPAALAPAPRQGRPSRGGLKRPTRPPRTCWPPCCDAPPRKRRLSETAAPSAAAGAQARPARCAMGSSKDSGECQGLRKQPTSSAADDSAPQQARQRAARCSQCSCHLRLVTGHSMLSTADKYIKIAIRNHRSASGLVNQMLGSSQSQPCRAPPLTPPLPGGGRGTSCRCCRAPPAGSR